MMTQEPTGAAAPGDLDWPYPYTDETKNDRIRFRLAGMRDLAQGLASQCRFFVDIASNNVLIEDDPDCRAGLPGFPREFHALSVVVAAFSVRETLLCGLEQSRRTYCWARGALSAPETWHLESVIWSGDGDRTIQSACLNGPQRLAVHWAISLLDTILRTAGVTVPRFDPEDSRPEKDWPFFRKSRAEVEDSMLERIHQRGYMLRLAIRKAELKAIRAAAEEIDRYRPGRAEGPRSASERDARADGSRQPQPTASVEANYLAINELIERLRRDNKGVPATLVEFMQGRDSATYEEIADGVYGDSQTGEGTIRSLVSRTNKHLLTQGSTLSFRNASGRVFKETPSR